MMRFGWGVERREIGEPAGSGVGQHSGFMPAIVEQVDARGTPRQGRRSVRVDGDSTRRSGDNPAPDHHQSPALGLVIVGLD